MNEGQQAKLPLQPLSEAERDALGGMIDGESASSLADRRSITVQDAKNLRLALKSHLGVEMDAEAVRIGLLAGLGGIDE